jgi:uncharacterized protein YoxC
MTKGNKIRMGMVLTEEGVEAYRELAKYLKAKYGKYRGLISLEISKAIQFYLQHLKASEGTPQSPQPQLSITIEKAKESKPIEHRETIKDLEQKVEGLTKGLEDLESLIQKVEDISKELKATEETVKNIFDTVRKLAFVVLYCEAPTEEDARRAYKLIMKEDLPEKWKKSLEEAKEPKGLFGEDKKAKKCYLKLTSITEHD